MERFNSKSWEFLKSRFSVLSVTMVDSLSDNETISVSVRKRGRERGVQRVNS